MQATKYLNIHRIEIAILCSFAVSCSAIFAGESLDKSQTATIMALNSQIGDYYCEHKYEKAAKTFEQVLPLLEKVSYFSESYLSRSYQNYSSVLNRLHRTDDSNKYAAKARELEAKAKRNELEKSKQMPDPRSSFSIQPTPSPVAPTGYSAEALVPPSLPPTNSAPTTSEVASYIVSAQRRVRRCWFPPANSEGKTAAIEFFVHSNGIISDIKIDKSAGSVEYDTAVRKSIENAAPFRPIVSECPIHFRCSFTGSKPGVLAQF